MIEWLIYMVTGVVAGTLAGLFGVGGGLIIVPVLVWTFTQQGFSELSVMHMAVGTSLMTIVVTSISSITAHYRQNTINEFLVKQMAAWLVVGSLMGAVLASLMSSDGLKHLVAVFAWIMAIKLWLPAPKQQSPKLLNKVFVRFYSTLTGVISAMVGIGGGTLVVPYLVMAGEPIRKAVGTAASCGFPIALAGAVGFMLTGSQQSNIRHDWLIGYVHLQAFIGIILASTLFAPLGAKLAKRWPANVLQFAFSLLLMVVGSYLVFT
jgi:hypothetical protein